MHKGNGSATGWRVRADQYSAAGSTQPVDAVVQNIQTWTTALNNVTSTSQATQNNNDLIYGFVYDENVTSTFTAGTGFTLRIGTSGVGSEDGTLSIAGSTSVTFTAGTAETGLIHLIALSPVSSNGGAGNPVMYADFENSTNGTTVTNTILNAGTHQTASWIGSWDGTTPLNGATVSTSAQMNLLKPVTVLNGSTYSDSSGTRGIQWSNTTATGYATYEMSVMSQQLTACFAYQTTVPTSNTGYYSLFIIENEFGDDFVSVMLHSGQIYLETDANPNGTPTTGSYFNYTPNTQYWICTQYVAGSGHFHSMTVYNSSGVQVGGMTKVNEGTNSLPNMFYLGRGGDSGTTGAEYIDNLVLRVDPGNYPFVP